jgi:hypothetical protein
LRALALELPLRGAALLLAARAALGHARAQAALVLEDLGLERPLLAPQLDRLVLRRVEAVAAERGG